MRRSVCLIFTGVALALLAASCTTPDVAPTPDVSAPVAAQPDVSPAEIEHTKILPTPEPSPPRSLAPELEPPEAARITPIPWGLPLERTGKRKGLEWTTTVQVERIGTGLQLALRLELRNATRKLMPISLHPPYVLVMTAPAPGSTDEGIGIGMRGEGMGSDPCSPGHGGPVMLPAGGRNTIERTVELDPLPWPVGQAARVSASSPDCRKGRASLEVLDVVVVQPASADGVPTIVDAKAKSSR